MSTALDHIRPVASPGRTGQGTAIEQSRAIAQVQAMVIVAQQCPRSVTAAIEAMTEACQQYELAQRAFFRFPRSGETITGPSVHLARELARCWGNIEHGVTELRRDDTAAESEMQAFAWDLQTNTRSASIFIVPHKRDTRSGVKDLTDMRDIYENNANNGARRLREAIFSVLPVWYREQAITLCQKTLEDGGGKPLAQRIAEAVKGFERHRVSAARLAAKFGHASVDDLTAADLAQLAVIYDSLRQGTVTVDDEFPPESSRVTAADITGGAPTDPSSPAPPQPPPAAASTPDAPVPAESAGEEGHGPAPAAQGDAHAAGAGPAPMLSRRRAASIQARFLNLGYADTPDDRAAWLSRAARLAGYDGDLTSLGQLTNQQGQAVYRQLQGVTSIGELDDLAQRRRRGAGKWAEAEATRP